MTSPRDLNSVTRSAIRMRKLRAKRAQSFVGQQQESKLNMRAHVKRAYGLTELEYQALRARAGDRCEACGSQEGEGKGSRLCVDHCHRTGKVRGLLCSPCNKALGFLREDKTRLAMLASYMDRRL